jgi:hypothetical protein
MVAANRGAPPVIVATIEFQINMYLMREPMWEKLSLQTTQAMREFIRNFDHSAYPDLVEGTRKV